MAWFCFAVSFIIAFLLSFKLLDPNWHDLDWRFAPVMFVALGLWAGAD